MRVLWLRQNEQVQVRTGLSSGGFESRRRTWMLPQWHPPEWSMVVYLFQPPHTPVQDHITIGSLSAALAAVEDVVA